MMSKTLTSMALAAGCAVALIVPAAHAQTTQYQRLMDRNEADLQSRMQRDCGSIANAHLRTGCMDSLAIEQDQRSRDLRDGLTGGGDPRMNPVDRTFQGPDMYDPHFGR